MREKNLFDLLAPAGKNKEQKRILRPVPPPGLPPLDRLAQDVADCRNCRLRDGAVQVVFGEGNPQARLMFVGEGPGAEEDAQGLPFVGAAGQLLNKILTAAEISRSEVYIANVVKCRPPANRTPQKDEVSACLPHLQRQIALIRPDIIVCLGSLATQALVDPDARVSAVRGRWFEKDGVRLMPTYHPAALLRDPSKKRPVWQDIQQVRDLYRSLSTGRKA